MALQIVIMVKLSNGLESVRSVSKEKETNYARFKGPLNLQLLWDPPARVWKLPVAMNSSSHMATSYLRNRI